MKAIAALEILKEYTTKPNLIKHAIAVSETMRHFAKLSGEDGEYWACVGMLHDIDYELYPDEHLDHTSEILKKHNFDDKFIHSVLSHGYGCRNDIAPECYMEQVLCTVDQLTGFIIACALIRPEKKLALVTLEGMQKRWKTPSFAAGTDRARIERFCAQLNKPLDYMMEQTLAALLGVAEKLGL